MTWETIQIYWRRVNELLRTRIWEPDIAAVSRLQRWAFRQLRVGVIFATGLAKGKIQLRASAMTFTTLLTLGPVLVLALSVFRSFGALQGVENQLEGYLLDQLSSGSQEQVRAWLVRFFAAVDQGAFRELSIVVLVGAVLGLLGSIEQAFNDIWGVHRGRSLFQRFSTYTTLMVFSPILIGLSLSVTASAETAALNAWLVTRSPVLEVLLRIGLRLGPTLLTGLAFTLLYTIMPNVRVSLRASLPAGLVAAVLWETLKFGYGAYMRNASHYGTLYGSLAAVPFFLIWVYVSWLVVLFGAQLAFARDAAQDFGQEMGAMTAGLKERLRTAIHIAIEAVRCFRDERKPPNLVKLSQRLRLPLRLVMNVAETLVDGGVLHQLSSDRREMLLVPARSPDRISVYDLYTCVAGNRGGKDDSPPQPAGSDGGDTRAPETEPDIHTVNAVLDDVDRTIRETWESRSLLDLLEAETKRHGQEVIPFPGFDGRGWTRGPRDDF